MDSPTPLDVQSLLPPLLACVSTALASPKPPPALLPLLSPILSQRVQLLSESPDCSSWLSLLNWDEHEAAQLLKIVKNAGLEPHPISGEIEVGDLEPSKYRRVDEETLQALLKIADAGIAVVFLWCTADGKQQWRVAELKPLHSDRSRNPTPWEASIRSAQDSFESRARLPVIVQQHHSDDGMQEAEEEDDDYWNRYDNTPARTPAKLSPAPGAAQAATKTKTNVDDSYWGQYNSVQPAMDGEDPDERAANQNELGQSSLDGNALLHALHSGQPEVSFQQEGQQRSLFTPNGTKNGENEKSEAVPRSLYTPNGTSTTGVVAYNIFPPTAPETRHSPTSVSYERIEHPRPQSTHSSSSSRGSNRLVEQLEEQAQRGATVADFAIQQHISTSLKSLYRLSKGAGMDRAEFERIVNAELGVLSMMDDD